MALHTGPYRVGNKLESSRYSTWWFYVTYCAESYPNDVNVSASDIASMKSYVSHVLGSNFTVIKEGDAFVSKMKKSAKDNLVQDHEFDWLNQNPRACYLAWGLLVGATEDTFNLWPGVGVLSPNAAPVYCTLLLSNNPSGHKERLSTIITYFDRWRCPSGPKRKALDGLKYEWQRANEANKSFKWLNENNFEQCEWVWRYIKDKAPSIYLQNLNPIIADDYYNAIHVAFDIWVCAGGNSAEIELFIIKLKKAWAQQKYRASKEGESAINTYISCESKKQLDELMVRYDEKLYEILERLIKKEYLSDSSAVGD